MSYDLHNFLKGLYTVNIFLFLAFNFLILAGCNDSNSTVDSNKEAESAPRATVTTTESYQQSQKPVKQACIIFVDVTRSISDTAAFNLTLRRLSKALLQLKPGSVYIIYALHGESGRSTIPLQDETETIPINPMSGSRKLAKQSQEELEEKLKAYKHKLIALYEKGRVNPKLTAYNETCILQTLPIIEEFFSEFTSTHFQRIVIYFSDMLEDCTRTGIDMDASNAISNMEKYINKEIKTNDIFKEVRVYCVLPGSSDGNKMLPSWLDDEKLKSIWRRVFANWGIDDINRNVRVSTNPPNSYINEHESVQK